MQSVFKRNYGIVGFCIGILFVVIQPVAAEEKMGADPVEALRQIEVLDLKTAAKIALTSSPTLAAAEARVTRAAQLVKQARAPYWPQLDAAAGYSRVELSQRNFSGQDLINDFLPPDQRISNPENYYRLGLEASWLVFDGLAREFRLAAAKYGKQASVAARDDAKRLLLSAVTFAYLQAQLAQENVAIAEADEAFNQRLLEEARLRYDVGTGALSDVLNFEVRVNAAKSSRLQEERGYTTGLVSLAALLGVPQGRLPNQVKLAELSPTTPQELAEPQTTQLVELALQLRPDLMRAEDLVQQAEAGVRTAQSGYYPSVALSAAYSGERPEDPGFEEDDFGNTVGVGLRWNLFAGGLTRAKTGEARAQLMEAQQLRNDAKVQVAAEINKIVTEIETAREVLMLQESNTKLVQRQRDLVEKEYKAGVGSLVRLNQAQRDLNVSQSQLALARVALRVSWYNLLTATGEILERFDEPAIR